MVPSDENHNNPRDYISKSGKISTLYQRKKDFMMPICPYDINRLKSYAKDQPLILEYLNTLKMFKNTTNKLHLNNP